MFFSQVKNDHLLGYDAATFQTSVANADTQSMGAELEGSWRFGNGLTLSGSVTHIDAKITKDIFNASGGPVRSGNRVPDVPHWSGRIAATYLKEAPDFLGIAESALHARASYRLAGERPADGQNHFNLSSYGKLDLHLGLIAGSAEVYLRADNLLNDTHDLYG